MTNWTPSHDPHAQREAEKYEKPIPSREFIISWLQTHGKPAHHGEIARALQLDEHDQIEALRRRLRAMERDGQLHVNRKGAYGLIEKMDLIKGRVIGHRDGFGFVVPEDGTDDLFLSARQMRAVFDGDKVLVRIIGIDKRGRREASLVEVVERNTRQVVGRYFEEHRIGYVVPDNNRISQDIFVPPEARNGATPGQIVVAEITEHPSSRAQAVGRIVEVLGEHMAPGMEIDIAIRKYEIPHEWPQAVLDEIQDLSPSVPESAIAGRVDLRALPFVTIDGEDARDFDDAVYVEKRKGGAFKLWVAIADVSHYVRPHTALDAEARIRGTSVYFPANVIPMLPEILSNGLCSLNPHVDRLALVAEIQISATGKVSRFRFCEAVFRSHARLTYTQVGAYLADPDSPVAEPFKQKWNFLQKPLQDAHMLYQLLRSVRDERGAIDFETTETKIIFGKERKIEKIVPTERNEAHKLIEEFMLCANVAAAKLLEKHKIAILYRVHEGPKDEKLNNLRVFLNEIGLSLGGGDTPQPGDYQAVLDQIRDRPDAHLIQTIMLRSMSQAVYSPENKGHFGLAYSAYAHFTSPIRRYPDLLVHRAIRFLLRSADSPQLWKAEDAKPPIPREKIFPYDFAAMVELGEHTSMTERRADDATRDAVAWLKCEYMLDHVGEEFTGIISAVTSFGFFTELNQIFVEGLVHVSSLPGDYYHFDAIQHRLKGERTGTLFCLGDTVRVKVVKVDLDARKIDFELVEGGARHRRGKKDAAAKPAPKNKGKGGGKGKMKALNRFSEPKKANQKAKSDKSPKARAADQQAAANKKKKKQKGKQKLSGRDVDALLTDRKDYVAGKVANRKSKGKPAP